MDCRRIAELIPLYVEGDLAQPGASRVRSHLQACADCRAQVAAYEASQAWLRASEPDFDEAFVDTIRTGVMRELAASEATPGLIERLKMWLTPRRLAAATAGLIVIFIAVMLFRDASRPRLAHQDNEMAHEPPAPPVENKVDGTKPVLGASKTINQPKRRTPNRAAPLLARQSRRDAVGAAAPQDHLVAQHPLNVMPAAPVNDSDAATDSKAMLRIELQTADPNIRIIWFAPRQTQTAAPQPMGDTL